MNILALSLDINAASQLRNIMKSICYQSVRLIQLTTSCNTASPLSL